MNKVRGRGRRVAIGRRHERPLTKPKLDPDFEITVVDRALLADALRALPDRQRTALVLRFYEDLSDADCGRVMGARSEL